MKKPYYIQSGPFYIVPVAHYNMEFAKEVRRAFLSIEPDCTAVELPETMTDAFVQAASRLPAPSVVEAESCHETLYFPIESCDASIEALRSSLETNTALFCIDLDVSGYPKVSETLPDFYSVEKIGLKDYFEAYQGTIGQKAVKNQFDKMRELHMARRLRELSFSFDRIFVTIGMHHVQGVLTHLKDANYDTFEHEKRDSITCYTYPEEQTRELLNETGFITTAYEAYRNDANSLIDRQKLHVELLYKAKKIYEEKKGESIAPNMMSQLFTFCRNWAHLHEMLLPDFYQLITACKVCIDHNFAYEVWKLATDYPLYHNIDNLPEKEFSIDDLWHSSKKMLFHLKTSSEKSRFERRLDKEKSDYRHPLSNFATICSYPPEDSLIEEFGHHLKKKARAMVLEKEAKTIPFSTSLEDGIDVKETIRHWTEKKLFVKTSGKPPGQVGSCVVIFEDEKVENPCPKYPCTFTWLGEHAQESDMAFFATSMQENIVGPGIVRCTFGGFMLSYPNRRLWDVWHDADYYQYRQKQDVLLAASIDYSQKPLIVFSAASPPSNQLKARAARQGKKIMFIPINSFSKREREKLRTFHILDSYEKRKIADEYIDNY